MPIELDRGFIASVNKQRNPLYRYSDEQIQRSRNIISPEGFPRIHLDRHIAIANQFFRNTFGVRYSPIQSAVDVVRRTGTVSLFDDGCGTANTLNTWGLAVAEGTACSPDQISMSGISLHDYRQESVNPATVQACRDGRINYMVGDAAHLAEMADNSVDVTLAYTSLDYAKDPIAWLKEMLRITKPGGYIYFDAPIKKEGIYLPLRLSLDVLESKGYKTDYDVATMVVPEGINRRLLGMIEKPSQN